MVSFEKMSLDEDALVKYELATDNNLLPTCTGYSSYYIIIV